VLGCVAGAVVLAATCVHGLAVFLGELVEHKLTMAVSHQWSGWSSVAPSTLSEVAAVLVLHCLRWQQCLCYTV
jgi:hypothetical protein